jgi:hypothetical protein
MNEQVRKSGMPMPVIATLVLAFIFIFPRLIVAWLGEASPWTCYLYQYGLGLVTFVIGIVLIRKTGACQMGRGRDTYWFKWLIAGFLIFAITHAVWIVLATEMPVKGGM